jgi:hypothetical protein
VSRPTRRRTIRLTRGVVLFLAVLVGTWMTYDGTRALTVGDYTTPRSGPYAGQLGPWAAAVAAVGIAPRSIAMRLAFVGLGLAWLVAAGMFWRRDAGSTRALAVVAVATVWYLPVGTLAAFVVLVGLAGHRRLRAN